VGDSVQKAMKDSIRSAQLARIQARVDTLKKRFEKTVDDFEDIWWFEPKDILTVGGHDIPPPKG
jgi:hypothetical protein